MYIELVTCKVLARYGKVNLFLIIVFHCWIKAVLLVLQVHIYNNNFNCYASRAPSSYPTFYRHFTSQCRYISKQIQKFFFVLNIIFMIYTSLTSTYVNYEGNPLLTYFLMTLERDQAT